LVGERLEEVEVAPVDQGQLDRLTVEMRGRLKAAESTADHHHPVRTIVHRAPGYSGAPA
jgi:hypothetical protein